MRALPIIIVLLLLAGIGFLLRNTVSGLFTGTTASNDSQTVVLRQSATPSPTATPTVAPAPTPTQLPQTASIANLNTAATPIPAASATGLPTSGPADGFVAAALVAAGLIGAYRLIAPKAPIKIKINIL